MPSGPIDVRVADQSETTVVFKLETEAAKAWWAENVSEPASPINSYVVVRQRAYAIYAKLVEASFNISVEG